MELIRLTENDVKRVALGYLKNYYKVRPRMEMKPTVSGLDMRGEGGIVADGFISFEQADGNVFTATFEATAIEQREEIFFEIRRLLLRWDSLTLGIATVTGIIGLLHYFGTYVVLLYSGWTAIFLALAGLLLAYLFWYAVLRYHRRYRVIFAIEQFKRYFVDEQWVAFAENVFDESNQIYYNELKRQCIRLGVGLFSVDAVYRPHLIVAPSRVNNFRRDRRIIRFVPLQDLQSRLQIAPMGEALYKTGSRFRTLIRGARRLLLPGSAEGQLKRLTGPLVEQYQVSFSRDRWNNFLRPFRERYRRGIRKILPHQLILVAFSGLVLTLLFVNQINRLPVANMEPEQYRARVSAIPPDEETSFLIIDAPIAPFDDSTFKPFDIPRPEEQFERLIQEDAPTGQPVAEVDVRIVISDPGELPRFYYDCNRFLGLTVPSYILLDTIVPTVEQARRRLDDINQQGLSGTVSWSPCLSVPGRGYLVFIDQVFTDSLEAARLLPLYEESLRLLDARLAVQTLGPPRRRGN